MQVINIWKASRAFANVVLSSRLGKLVSELAGCIQLSTSLHACFASAAKGSECCLGCEKIVLRVCSSDGRQVADSHKIKCGQNLRAQGARVWSMNENQVFLLGAAGIGSPLTLWHADARCFHRLGRLCFIGTRLISTLSQLMSSPYGLFVWQYVYSAPNLLHVEVHAVNNCTAFVTRCVTLGT